MKKEIANLWVAALRSEQYGQCAGKLRDRMQPNNFCCLGVLCNLHAQAHPEDAATQIDVGQYLGADICLPEAVMEWAGMKTSFGRFQTGPYSGSLARQNDSGVPFARIADIIETRWEVL